MDVSLPAHPGRLLTGMLAASIILGAAYAKIFKPKRRLPPGPPGLPLLGNIYDVPAENFWITYKEWSDQYKSDIIYLNMMGTPVIVLNSYTAVKELLEQRSSIYSSRPNMPMLNDLIGFDFHFAFMPYNEAWKERRKVFQREFHPSKTHLYRPAALSAVRTLLIQLLDDPADFPRYMRMLAGAFILHIAYGIEVKSNDDVYIRQAEKGMQAMAAAGTASTYLVDFFPVMKSIPDWMPGASFKRAAKEWRKDVRAMAHSPMDFVKRAMDEGTALPCIATRLLEELSEDGEEPAYDKEAVIRDVLGSVYAAGSDTTVSSFGTFTLAMLQHPEIQKNAQAAIDASILALGRLPDYSDYGTMPYIDAIVREVLRWRPVTPVAVPHSVMEDDVYEGYHIPAGSTILPNCWAISHDPALYGPNPACFDPSRFLDSDGALRPEMPQGYETFGYGRRICPGLQIAVESIWLAVVSILAVFDIKPMAEAEDASALKCDTKIGEYTSGMLIHPVPFDCRFVPRSPEAVKLIKAGLSNL